MVSLFLGIPWHGTSPHPWILRFTLSTVMLGVMVWAVVLVALLQMAVDLVRQLVRRIRGD